MLIGCTKASDRKFWSLIAIFYDALVFFCVFGADDHWPIKKTGSSSYCEKNVAFRGQGLSNHNNVFVSFGLFSCQHLYARLSISSKGFF